MDSAIADAKLANLTGAAKVKVRWLVTSQHSFDTTFQVLALR